jgi:hypothetical protein
MNDLEQKVAGIIDQLQSLAKPAMHTAIESVRVSGILYLIAGLACAFLCTLAVKVLVAQCKAAKAANYDEDMPHVIFAIVAGVLSIGFGIATCVNLLDPGNWLAAARPDLWLARALVYKVL